MKCQSLRGFGPDSGQMFELVDQAFDGFGEIRHQEFSVTERGGPERQSRRERFLALPEMTKIRTFLKTS